MCTFKKEERAKKRRSRKTGEACRGNQRHGLGGGKQNFRSRMGETEWRKLNGGNRKAEQRGGSRRAEAECRKQKGGSRI
jgi:hypothetical protein